MTDRSKFAPENRPDPDSMSDSDWEGYVDGIVDGLSVPQMLKLNYILDILEKAGGADAMEQRMDAMMDALASFYDLTGFEFPIAKQDIALDGEGKPTPVAIVDTAGIKAIVDGITNHMESSIKEILARANAE